MTQRIRWTAEAVAELRRRYPDEDNAKIAQDFGCSVKSIAVLASRYGIRKSAKFVEERYTKTGRKRAEEVSGERRVVATGTVTVIGNVLTHLGK